MKNNERPSPVKVGEKLRNLRKKKGLTLKKLSEKAELSIGYLSNLERDACSPTLENMFGEDEMEGLCITLEPHTKYDASNWVHNYDEIGLIIEGSMEIRIEKDYHHLNKGDAFYIKAKTNHSLSNDTDARCISYWVKSLQSE